MEYMPKVTQLCNRLEAARAKLAAIPRHTLLPVLPWDNAGQNTVRVIAETEADIKQLEQLLHVAERNTIQHLLDLLECIPQDRDNYTIVREALLYARALAKLEESVI